MFGKVIRLVAVATVLSLAPTTAVASRDVHHLSGGGTASISQVAMNVAVDGSGSASGSFECLMASSA
jgi:hypothetical protein